jgi:hypothetical protein
VKAPAGVVTLWDLLVVMSFTNPLGSVLFSAKHEHAGLGGYAVAITVGLALGVSWAWTTLAVGKAIGTNVLRPDTRYSDSQKEWVARALYFSAMLWIFFGSFSGMWAWSALMRLTG